MSNTSANPGWYPNPDGSGTERYWNGVQWTDQIRAQGVPPIPPAAPPPGAPPPTPLAPAGRSKRPVWRRPVPIIIIAVVVVIIVIAAVAGSGSKKSSSTGAASPSTTMARASATDTPTEPPSTAPTTTLPTVGSTLKIPGGTATFVGWNGASPDKMLGFETVPAARQAVLATVKVCAVTKPVDVNPLYWAAIQTDNTKLDPTDGLVNTQLDSGTVSVGDCVKGDVAFTVDHTNAVVALELDDPLGARQARWMVH